MIHNQVALESVSDLLFTEAMRKSSIFLAFISLTILLGSFLLVIHPALTADSYRETLELKKRFVRDLGLTDLCLFTEARYTRHLTQADLHSAFQDHPLSLEHFPSGSLIYPRRP